MALVVLVIFLFLRNLSATVIPSVAVPLSLVGTFGVMYLAGFCINNLTLMALTIATGFVVDDAIVMIENIARYIEKGETPLEAALKGSEQIGFTIISLTFSLIAVLIPLLFMGDVVGRLFREFAITLAVAILISGVVSLTLTPMMCAKSCAPVSEKQSGRFYRSSGRFFDETITTLRPDAELGAGSPGHHAAGGGRDAGADRGAVCDRAQGLLPGAGHRRDPGHHRSAADRVVCGHGASASRRWPRWCWQDPAVESLSSFIGVDGTNATLNSGRMLINLKPLAERGIDASEVIRRLQPKLAEVPGITLYMQPVQDLTIEDRVSRTQYQFTLEAVDLEELSHWMHRLVEQLCAQRRIWPMWPATCRTRGCRPTCRYRPRHAPAGSASRRRRSTTRSTTPSASG